MPGLVDHAGASVTRIPQKWEDAANLDIDAWTRHDLGIPATLENDARAALVGEWHHGAGRGTGNLVMITLGTGIGVAAVVDGRVIRGAHGAAGVLGGHLQLDPIGRRCMCGLVGCAEAEASTWALAEIAQELLGPAPAAETVTYEHLADLAEHDERFRTVWDRSLQIWSALIVKLVHAYDPERVVIGGGIARNSSIVEVLSRSLDSDPWMSDWEIPIVPTELGDDAALLAAPWLIDRSAAVHSQKRSST